MGGMKRIATQLFSHLQAFRYGRIKGQELAIQPINWRGGVMWFVRRRKNAILKRTLVVAADSLS